MEFVKPNGYIILWWSQKSSQFAVKNKTKHNHSKKLVLSAFIDLHWRLIVQHSMKPLLIAKRKVHLQVAHRVYYVLVIFDIHLLIFDTAPRCSTKMLLKIRPLPSQLMRISAALRRLINSVLVKYTPWSVLCQEYGQFNRRRTRSGDQ